MKLKNFALASVIASIGTFATAKQYDLGDLTNETQTIEHTFQAGTGSFTDRFLFTVTGAASTILGLVTPANAGTEWNINSLLVRLRDGSNAVVGTDLNPLDGFSFTGLAAGSYELRYRGETTGSFGGGYRIAVTEVSAPVPEPETYALFFAGLGVIGFVARRRRPQ